MGYDVNSEDFVTKLTEFGKGVLPLTTRVESVAGLIQYCHGVADQCGWWRDPKTGERITRKPTRLLMLCITEAGEAVEADRKKLADDHLPGREGRVAELADIGVRLADMAGGLGLTDEVVSAAVDLGPVRSTGLESLDGGPLEFDEGIYAICSVLSSYDPEEPEELASIIATSILLCYALAENFDLPLAEVLAEKVRYNGNRADHKLENRRAENGKAY